MALWLSPLFAKDNTTQDNLLRKNNNWKNDVHLLAHWRWSIVARVHHHGRMLGLGMAVTTGAWSSLSLLSLSDHIREKKKICQELNYSGATLDYFPMLLWCTFPHYSGPPLDWTGLHSTCLLTRLAPDLTWEVAVIHLSLMYLFLIIYTHWFQACFQPIYILSPTHFSPQLSLPHTGSGWGMHFTYLFLYYLLTVLAWAHTALYLVCVRLWALSVLSSPLNTDDSTHSRTIFPTLCNPGVYHYHYVGIH